MRLQGYHGNKKYIKYWKKLENEISYIVLLYYSTYIAKIQKSILHNFRKAHFVCYTAPLWMEYLKGNNVWNQLNKFEHFIRYDGADSERPVGPAVQKTLRSSCPGLFGMKLALKWTQTLGHCLKKYSQLRRVSVWKSRKITLFM